MGSPTIRRLVLFVVVILPLIYGAGILLKRWKRGDGSTTMAPSQGNALPVVVPHPLGGKEPARPLSPEPETQSVSAHPVLEATVPSEVDEAAENFTENGPDNYNPWTTAPTQ